MVLLNQEGQILLTFNDVLNSYTSKTHGINVLKKYNQWFPVKASSKLAGIIADLMGDGHLQGNPKWRIDYTSKRSTELKRFNNEIKSLFGVKGKIRECTTNAYKTKNLGINNSQLTRTLYLLGAPVGNKVTQKFSIPVWIKNNKTYFSRFINRLFSCEACVDSKYKGIEIQMYKSVDLIVDGIYFFEEIKYYLNKYYNIRTTNPFLEKRSNIRKDGIITKAIRLKIRNRQSFINFHKFIGLDDKRKMKKLDLLLNI